MWFEYNGHLLEDDRINLVAKEIIIRYPQISLSKAKEAAQLEGKISSTKTIREELHRLYNIMLVNCDDKNMVMSIYPDFVMILKNASLEEKNNYIDLALSINNYLQNNCEFPLLDNDDI